jgi:SIR2-like domain
MDKLPQPLIQKILSGKVTLFIGAGASIPAGLPSGNEITNALKKHFSGANQNISDFMDFCQDIEETPPYDRNELDEIVKGLLEPFELTNGHKIMTEYDWGAIFTTNFDTIIETAYRTTPSRNKACSPVTKENPNFNVSDKSRVYLFKIMGTVDGEDSSSMVLTRSDFNHSLVKRRQYLNVLLDFVKSGTIVYLGYSFRDRIARDIISEVTKLFGINRLPYSYMVTPDLPKDQKGEYFLSSNKILPIEGDFVSFFQNLKEVSPISKVHELLKPKPKATLRIQGREISIGEKESKTYSSSFDIISEESFNSNCEIEAFLKGMSDCWDAYNNNWDFKRKAFSFENPKVDIASTINEEALKTDTENNRVLYLTGMPGCGKSILTRRLAFDYYKEKGPVLLFSQTKNIDFKIVTAFVEDVNNQYDKYFEKTEKIKPIKPLLVFDDAAGFLKDILRLKNYLSSRGRACLILATGRLNEIDNKSEDFRTPISNSDHFILNETLDDTEAKEIIEYLYRFNFIGSKSERWSKIIEKNYDNSLFATFYSIVHPSRKPLNEIIVDQYNSLSDVAKSVFLNICCFSQFDLYINVELVVRSINIDYSDFYDILAEVKKIIFEDEDYLGNLTYRAHHRIIARKTLDFFVGKEQLYETYLQILQRCILSNIIEKDIIESFLIEHISKDSKSNLTLEEKSRLFLAVCDHDPTRSLCHHLGLIEIEAKEFDVAEKYLKMALALPRDFSEHYRGESDQNILTSLGKLNSIVGLELLKAGKIEDSASRFEFADRFFNDAKHGEYVNSYAYHANAYMWFQKAIFENNRHNNKEYAQALSRSLEIINVAKDNINNAELLPIYELEVNIWANFNDESSVKRFINMIIAEFNSPQGYFIYACYYFQKATNSYKYKELYLKTCLKHLNDALSLFPRAEKCLALKCKVLLNLNESDDGEMFDILSEWRSVSDNDNAYLLYNYARLAFVNGYYSDSEETFRELDNGIGMGNRNRSKPANEIMDHSTGLPKAYHGEVVEIYGKTEGKIKVTSVSEKVFVNFRPVAAKFTANRGSLVDFYIAFSYRGPFAVDVSKG